MHPAALELTPGQYPVAADAAYTVKAIDEFGNGTAEQGVQTGKVSWAGELAGHDAIVVKATLTGKVARK